MAADTLIEDAVQLMRERSVRRLVIVESNQPTGVVSLGDLAKERDPSSVLADISGAPAQH
jgi:CBS domain-containing protein